MHTKYFWGESDVIRFSTSHPNSSAQKPTALSESGCNVSTQQGTPSWHQSCSLIYPPLSQAEVCVMPDLGARSRPQQARNDEAGPTLAGVAYRMGPRLCSVHRLPKIHPLLGTSVNKLSQLECRSSWSLTTSSEVLSTLSGVLGAVGLVTGQSTAVGGHNAIDVVLQLPDAR